MRSENGTKVKIVENVLLNVPTPSIAKMNGPQWQSATRFLKKPLLPLSKKIKHLAVWSHVPFENFKDHNEKRYIDLYINVVKKKSTKIYLCLKRENHNQLKMRV